MLAPNLQHHTDNPDVARMMIAWQIAITSLSTMGGRLSDGERKQLTDWYIEAYNALLANEVKQQKP